MLLLLVVYSIKRMSLSVGRVGVKLIVLMFEREGF